ncbi:hypothetical protein KKH43_00135 [Patescibacteria group bacterium]|nr:hypothetical protein [Patescibacteria group bacterium]
MLKQRVLNGVVVVIGAVLVLMLTSCLLLAGAEGSRSIVTLWSDLLHQKLFFTFTFIAIIVCFSLGFIHNPRKAL